jgi:hypothetical protein
LLDAVPAVLTYVPAAHVVHAEQLPAFVVVENVPLAHAVHVRFVVADPALVTYWPAVQVVRAWHTVAELPSWSHSLAPHAAFAVAPPAQYVPASHATHVGGVVAVPATVCSVPAAHAPCG